MFSFHENTVGGRGIAEARAFDPQSIQPHLIWKPWQPIGSVRTCLWQRGRSGSGEVFIQRRVHFKL